MSGFEQGTSKKEINWNQLRFNYAQCIITTTVHHTNGVFLTMQIIYIYIYSKFSRLPFQIGDFRLRKSSQNRRLAPLTPRASTYPVPRACGKIVCRNTWTGKLEEIAPALTPRAESRRAVRLQPVLDVLAAACDGPVSLLPRSILPGSMEATPVI